MPYAIVLMNKLSQGIRLHIKSHKRDLFFIFLCIQKGFIVSLCILFGAFILLFSSGRCLELYHALFSKRLGKSLRTTMNTTTLPKHTVQHTSHLDREKLESTQQS